MKSFRLLFLIVLISLLRNDILCAAQTVTANGTQWIDASLGSGTLDVATIDTTKFVIIYRMGKI